MYRKIKMEITTPTIRTTHAPTIPPTVTGRLFDRLWDEPIGAVPISKKKNQVCLNKYHL